MLSPLNNASLKVVFKEIESVFSKLYCAITKWIENKHKKKNKQNFFNILNYLILNSNRIIIQIFGFIIYYSII